MGPRVSSGRDNLCLLFLVMDASTSAGLPERQTGSSSPLATCPYRSARSTASRLPLAYIFGIYSCPQTSSGLYIFYITEPNKKKKKKMMLQLFQPKPG